MKKKRAALISLEGIEGTGKSTQCRLLEEFFRAQRLRGVVFREPGATALGEQIRQILLHGDCALSGAATAMLFAAARVQLVQERIIPALDRYDVVVLDRYCDATIAYQGHGDGVDQGLIRSLNRFATAGVVPDLTILLDLPVRKGIARSGRTDRFERRTLAYHQRVRQGYILLANQYPRRIKLLDAGQSIDEIQQRIQTLVIAAVRRRRGTCG